MPGMYGEDEYDLAGFIVGAVERNRMLTGTGIRAGDVLLGLPSTGLHSNGYSLARKLFFEVAGYGVKTFLPELNCTVGDELLKVHRSYLTPIQTLLSESVLKGAAHITGGGMSDNIPRILPSGLAVEITRGSWPVLPVFEVLKELGSIPEDDYRRTFNLGIGMVLIVGQRNLSRARRILEVLKETYYEIGRVAAARRGAASRVVYV
jgi:phosphoribosylformylglycinamidine cyclo-ligase